jgi:hypothetical protein
MALPPRSCVGEKDDVSCKKMEIFQGARANMQVIPGATESALPPSSCAGRRKAVTC